MYVIRFVQFDCLRTIETISRDKANQEYLERVNDPTVTELKALILTADVKFTSNGKVYTYFTDISLKGYSRVKLLNGDVVQIIGEHLRTVEELKVMAKSRGFSFADYKVLHGTAIK